MVKSRCKVSEESRATGLPNFSSSSESRAKIITFFILSLMWEVIELEGRKGEKGVLFIIRNVSDILRSYIIENYYDYEKEKTLFG